VGPLGLDIRLWEALSTVEAAASSKLKVLVGEPHRTVAGAIATVVGERPDTSVAAVTTASDVVALGQRICPDVAIVDLDLSPGASVIAELHRRCPETRIIALADREGGDAQSMVRALAAGAVGAVYKESSFDGLARALETSTKATPVVAEEAAGILLNSYVDALADKEDRNGATIRALATAVEARDIGTGRHLHRVTKLAVACMERIDIELAQNEEIAYGSMLHDVGKIGIPDAVLNKPGPLDPHEWGAMRRHPEIGLQIVQPIGFSRLATDIILCHHERWDGRGYPNGLSREDIPVVARAFSVADAFDAMTSHRPYRPAMERSEALRSIKLDSGTLFDPHVVATFVDLVD
jgi:response regulator RpfG family c-di-GMP phosphodiesterase